MTRLLPSPFPKKRNVAYRKHKTTPFFQRFKEKKLHGTGDKINPRFQKKTKMYSTRDKIVPLSTKRNLMFGTRSKIISPFSKEMKKIEQDL